MGTSRSTRTGARGSTGTRTGRETGSRTGRQTGAGTGTAPLRLRPTGAPAVTAAALLLLVATAVGAADGSPAAAGSLLVVCPVLAVAAAFLLPVLVVDVDGLDVVGVLRRRRVPWAAVAHVRQGWFVELVLVDGSRVVCLAAPVVGSMAAFRTLDEDEHDLFSRRSAEHPAFHGARGSLAVELVEARRYAGGRAPGAAGGTGATGGAGAVGAGGAGGAVEHGAAAWRVVPVLGVAVLLVVWLAAAVALR